MGAVLVPAFERARKDPIGRMLAAASSAGVRFAFAGATFRVEGADRLDDADRALLRQYVPDIRERLAPPEPEVDLLTLLDVDVEVIRDLDRAQSILSGLGNGPYGFDLETAARDGSSSPRPWLRITKSGHRAQHQPRDGDGAGLDPFRGRPRLAQLYVPPETVYVFDLAHMPVNVLCALEDRILVAHNSAFEATMLLPWGVRLRKLYCTRLLAAMAMGAERGGLKLTEVAKSLLNLELPKHEQTSDWGAEWLSQSQYRYAAADAVVSHKIALALRSSLEADTWRAFLLGNATVPAVAAMRLAGIPFDQKRHRETIAAWERDYTAAREAFEAITGVEVPAPGLQRSAWLEARMPAEMLSWWPRTATGQLSLQRQHLERLAAVPEIRPLLDVVHLDKRLRAFGHGLLERVGGDGRLHMDLKPAWTKTGRCSCSAPNLQQLPQDVRHSVIAPPGRTFLVLDYNQIELRVAAELSGEPAMRKVFADGLDMHRLNAAAFVGCSPEEVSDEERRKAKPIGFGTLYGSGAEGLVASAWANYRVEMGVSEAQTRKDAFYRRYPRLRAWQSENAERAHSVGVLRSRVGRPLRADWENGNLRWTLCCNYPVQSSAAEVVALAMKRVHDALANHDAFLILQIHDELLVECAEGIASEIESLVADHMTAAFAALFPDAPVNGLVDAATRPCWAKEKTP